MPRKNYGVYPIYLPRSALFTEKLVMDAHLNTLHGGVGDTMTKVREKYWIPKLRQLTKSVRYRCNGCKKFQTTASQLQLKEIYQNIEQEVTEDSKLLA